MAQHTPGPKFSPAERRNWGYWDGVSARERGRLPEWAPLYSGVRHPFDKPYGDAFWLGWNGEAHPNTGAALAKAEGA